MRWIRWCQEKKGFILMETSSHIVRVLLMCLNGFLEQCQPLCVLLKVFNAQWESSQALRTCFKQKWKFSHHLFTLMPTGLLLKLSRRMLFFSVKLQKYFANFDCLSISMGVRSRWLDFLLLFFFDLPFYSPKQLNGTCLDGSCIDWTNLNESVVVTRIESVRPYLNIRSEALSLVEQQVPYILEHETNDASCSCNIQQNL